MVDVHGPDKHADGSTCLGDLGNSLRGELLHLDVRLNLLDDGITDVVFIIIEERLKELAGIIQNLLCSIPAFSETLV